MIQEIPYASRDEWLELRKAYIGGSDAGAVVGLNPYSSRYALWAEKTGRVPGFSGNISTRVGQELEDLVARLFCEEQGKKVRRKNRMLVNEDYPFACADVDRMVVGEKALLECKTTASVPVMRQIRQGDYPSQWYAQMTHYLAVTGMERAYLAVLIANRDFQVYTLERDEDEIRALMDAEREFAALIRTDTPPETDGSDATAETLREIYPESSGGEALLVGLELMMSRRQLLTETKKDIEKDIAEIDNTIKAGMGDAERASCEGWTVTWKDQTRRTLDQPKLKEAYPDVDLDHFMKESTSRVFRVTKKGAKKA